MNSRLIGTVCYTYVLIGLNVNNILFCVGMDYVLHFFLNFRMIVTTT